MCCWEHYLWYFSHMKGFWTRSIFKIFTLRFIDSLKSFSTSLNSGDKQDKETRLYWVSDGIADHFDGKWLSFAFVCCAESILSGLPQRKKKSNGIFHSSQDICIIQILNKRTDQDGNRNPNLRFLLSCEGIRTLSYQSKVDCIKTPNNKQPTQTPYLKRKILRKLNLKMTKCAHFKLSADYPFFRHIVFASWSPRSQNGFVQFPSSFVVVTLKYVSYVSRFGPNYYS